MSVHSVDVIVKAVFRLQMVSRPAKMSGKYICASSLPQEWRTKCVRLIVRYIK